MDEDNINEDKNEKYKKLFDKHKNEDEMLSHEEVHNILNECGKKTSLKESEELILKITKDNKTKSINFEGFVKLMDEDFEEEIEKKVEHKTLKKGGGGGGSSKPPGDKYQKTTQDLDKNIEEQELKIKNLETKCKALEDEAKAKLKAKDRSGAARLVAKKKKYVEQIKQLEGAVAMMEEQKMMLDNTIQLSGVMKTIKNTNAVVKEAAKEMNIEELDKMKEDMEELKADQEELTGFFKEYGEQNTEDVEEDLAELEAQMEKEEAGELPSANVEVLNPSQPQKVQNKEEDDLNKFLAV